MRPALSIVSLYPVEAGAGFVHGRTDNLMRALSAARAAAAIVDALRR
jgi:hypothetical protein